MNRVTASHEEGLGARHLRRILRLYLAAWGMDDLYDSASLALTELIANVVRHCPGRRATVLILRLPQEREYASRSPTRVLARRCPQLWMRSPRAGAGS
ncbi:hypothetical protein [Streptomyces sp. NBC_00457]|uniref:hypothetical protein n=1 Tax=Streptomyces sp. NBC_00457 TaxID=2975748 RepID=UPI002E1D84C2